MRILKGLAVLLFVVEWCQATQVPSWSGSGQYRILIKVDAVALEAGRTSDEMVARYDVDFAEVMQEFGAVGFVDPSTLQIHKFDPCTGEPEPFASYDSSSSPYDRPCRFEDDLIPDDYPSRNSYPSNYPSGQGPLLYRQRGGRLFNRMAAGDRGHIVWIHNQNNMASSYYALYWNTVESSSERGASPGALVGDGDVVRKASGENLVGTAQTRISAGDLDGDGLFDFVTGDQKGNILFWRNYGVLGSPRFIGCEALNDEDGPIVVGWYTNPCVLDWNHDGLLDLLVGTSNNVILWWKNIGTTISPQFSYQGFVQADGQRLENPETPCAEDPQGTQFLSDYCAFPYACDWDGDGLVDLLVGSYITGQVSFYRNVGLGPDGVPQLTYVGPLMAGGEPIDTVWCSMPAAEDFDNDGLPELMLGNWRYQAVTPTEDFIMYYNNLGTAQDPQLMRRPFPKSGQFPSSIQASIAVVDWNHDQLKDLVVMNGTGDLYLYLNRGTLTEPSWLVDNTSITCQWGFVQWPFGAVSSMFDIDGDGRTEILSGNTICRMYGSPYSPQLVVLGRATVNGEPIWHEGPGYGDAYNFNVFADWNHDGKYDILCGTQQGNIYYHQNLGAPDNLSYGPGVKLVLLNGEDVKVGPPVYDNPADVPDFTALQGSRAKPFMNDVDGDGIDDLLIIDTYSNIWVFRNTVQSATDKLESGVVVRQSVTRGQHDLIDWNMDGKMDLVAGPLTEDPGTIYLNQSTPGMPAFSEGVRPMGLPYLFWGAVFHGIDWNGDGDRDFIVHSEFYGFYIERSFIDHGYIPGQRKPQPRVNLVESQGKTEVSEAGDIDTYQVALSQAPTADVTVTLQCDNQLTVMPQTLFFTASNWNEAQLVTVTAVDDDVYESYPPETHQGVINHIIEGSDYEFPGSVRLMVSILDNDRQCGDAGTVYLDQDFNQDCHVDINDFSSLAHTWLVVYDPTPDQN